MAARSIAAFAGLPLVVEVRHASWNSGEVLADLAERGVGLVNVDQPLFGNSISRPQHATSSVAYVRMHRRNYQEWFRKSADRNQRYDYLYTADELRPWVERIKQISARPTTKELYAVTNNHNLGKAPANGGMIEAMLWERKVPLPPGLFARYRSVLEPFTIPDRAEEGDLFGEIWPDLNVGIVLVGWSWLRRRIDRADGAERAG